MTWTDRLELALRQESRKRSGLFSKSSLTKNTEGKTSGGQQASTGSTDREKTQEKSLSHDVSPKVKTLNINTEIQ